MIQKQKFGNNTRVFCEKFTKKISISQFQLHLQKLIIFILQVLFHFCNFFVQLNFLSSQIVIDKSSFCLSHLLSLMDNIFFFASCPFVPTHLGESGATRFCAVILKTSSITKFTTKIEEQSSATFPYTSIISSAKFLNSLEGYQWKYWVVTWDFMGK